MIDERHSFEFIDEITHHGEEIYTCLGIGNISLFCTNRKIGHLKRQSSLCCFRPLIENVRLIRPFVLNLVFLDGFPSFLGPFVLDLALLDGFPSFLCRIYIFLHSPTRGQWID
jgi:hypothetical protein